MLGFDNLITQSLVEGMGFFSNDVGAKANRLQTLRSRPTLDASHQKLPDSPAAKIFVHDQAADLSLRIAFDESIDKGMDPSHDPAIRTRSHVSDVRAVFHDFQDASSNLRWGGGITELYRQSSDLRGILNLRHANSKHIRSGRLHGHEPAEVNLASAFLLTLALLFVAAEWLFESA
jgi:hypothetical protein